MGSGKTVINTNVLMG